MIKERSITMKYATSKTCSREIDFEVENNIVTSCEFVGGDRKSVV